MKAEEKILGKKEMLFNAALELFSVKSFDDASLNDILKSTSISKGAFYYSFKDKLDLYKQLFERVSIAKLEFLQKLQADKNSDTLLIQPDNMTIFDFLKKLAAQGIAFTKAYPKYYKFALMYTYESDIFKKSIEGDQAKYADDFLNDMVQKAYDRGDIDLKYPIEFTKSVLIYTMTNYFDIVGFSDVDDMKKCYEELNLFYDFLERGFTPMSV